MNTYYRHLRATLLQKDHTYAGVETDKGTVLIGLAVTHPNDYFSKQVGRTVSFENAHLKPLAEVVIQDGDSSEYTFYRFVSQLMPKQSFDREILKMAYQEDSMVIE